MLGCNIWREEQSLHSKLHIKESYNQLLWCHKSHSPLIWCHRDGLRLLTFHLWLLKKGGKCGYVKTHAILNVALTELNKMQRYVFVWPQKCDPSSVLTAEMWLPLRALANQWVRARSNECCLLQLRISSNILSYNKGTKGSAMTLPQVRGSTWPREQPGKLWLSV